jgi:ferrous iron transport protein B
LAVLTGASIAELRETLHTLFSPLSALSFLTFTLLYTPCMAAVAAVRRELGSLKGTIFVILYQIGIAWVVAFCVYRIGRLFI